MRSSASEITTLGTGLLSALLAVIARIDPDGILSNQGMQDDVLAVFVAAVPVSVLVWAWLHGRPPTLPPTLVVEERPPQAPEEPGPQSLAERMKERAPQEPPA